MKKYAKIVLRMLAVSGLLVFMINCYGTAYDPSLVNYADQSGGYMGNQDPYQIVGRYRGNDGHQWVRYANGQSGHSAHCWCRQSHR